MTKEPLFIDLIDGLYIGGRKKADPSKKGRKKPVIRAADIGPFRSLSMGVRNLQDYPYEITEEDMVSWHNGYRELIFAIPNSDIPGVDPENTVLHKILSSIGESGEKWHKKYKEEKREKLKWKKQYEMLAEEEAERQKQHQRRRGNSGRVCETCGEGSTLKTWKKNDGFCPECSVGKLADASPED